MDTGKGDSYWKPPFSGAMLVSGRVLVSGSISLLTPLNPAGALVVLALAVACGVGLQCYRDGVTGKSQTRFGSFPS